MEKILDLCPEALAIASSDEDANLPLHLACQTGHAEVTERIVNIMLEGATTEKALLAAKYVCKLTHISIDHVTW